MPDNHNNEELEQQDFINKINANKHENLYSLRLSMISPLFQILPLATKVIVCIEQLLSPPLDRLETIELPAAYKFGEQVISGLVENNFAEYVDDNSSYHANLLDYLAQSPAALLFIIKKYIKSDSESNQNIITIFMQRVATHKLNKHVYDANVNFLYFYMKCTQAAKLEFGEKQIESQLIMLMSALRGFKPEIIEDQEQIKAPEISVITDWCNLFDYLAKFEEGTLEYNFRNLVEQKLQGDHRNNPILKNLHVENISTSRWIARNLFWHDQSLSFLAANFKRPAADVSNVSCSFLPLYARGTPYAVIPLSNMDKSNNETPRVPTSEKSITSMLEITRTPKLETPGSSTPKTYRSPTPFVL